MSGSSRDRESPHFYIVILHAGAVLKDFMPYPAPDGVAAQDGEKAFRAAHTLKGVCLNLGFTELYKVSAELTEVLRGRETAGSDELYAQVKEQYTTLTDAIRELAGN